MPISFIFFFLRKKVFRPRLSSRVSCRPVIIWFCSALKGTKLRSREARGAPIPAVKIIYLAFPTRFSSVSKDRVGPNRPRTPNQSHCTGEKNCIVRCTPDTCRIRRDRSNTPMIALLRAERDGRDGTSKGGIPRVRVVCTCAWKDKSPPPLSPSPTPLSLSLRPAARNPRLPKQPNVPFSTKCSRDGLWTVSGKRSIPSPVDLTHTHYHTATAYTHPCRLLFGQSARPSGKWRLPTGSCLATVAC